MAKSTNKARRPVATAPGPRRLGGDAPRPPTSQGQARRAARRRTGRSSRYGWLAVGLVVLAVVGVVVWRLTASSPKPSATGDSAGDNPALASAAMVTPITTIPASVYNSVGTAGLPSPFIVTSGQPPLTTGGKPEFVYVGAEYCPYCAMMRWSLVAALSRFGTFSGLKQTSSANDDGDIPTFSFLGATYKSPYLVFSPYEEEDRNQNTLQTPPNNVLALYAKYDGNDSSDTAAKPFNQGNSPGIPFLDIANKYTSVGDSNAMYQLVPVLQNGGPGTLAIADAIHDPTSAVGKSISADVFVSQANYTSAAICSIDHGAPASVCKSPGVLAAAKVLAAEKPIG